MISKKTMKYINLKNPRHAYFFGFVQTDGSLGKLISRYDKGRLTIEVGQRDSHILYSFQRLFASVYSSVRTRTRNTNFKNSYKSSVFTISYKGFREEINRLGVPYGKKSDIIGPPKTSFCERDYLRGLIDGDGSLGRTGRGDPFISISIKSEALKNYLCEIIEKILGERKRLVRNQRDNTYNIMINRERAQRFIRYLYYSGSLALKRKLKKAREALKWKRPKNLKKLSQKFWEPFEDKYIIAHSMKESCRYLTRTESSVKMRLWRLDNHCAPYLKACLSKT